MQFKRAGFLTKVVVVVLVAVALVTLQRMQGQIAQATQERDALQLQVANQTQINADLRDAVEYSDDPERRYDIARTELGLVAPGEKVIIFTD